MATWWQRNVAGRWRRRGRRPVTLLAVNGRGRGRGGANAQVWLRLIGIPVAVVVAVGLALLGLWSLGGMLYSRNRAFTIRHVSLAAADASAGGFLESKYALRKGANLFGFDIQDVSREFLAKTPHYQAIRITRVLPDTLEVHLVPRQPVAVIGRRGGLAVDGDGHVFNQRSASTAGLPLLIGYQGRFLKPGEQVQGLAADAAHLVRLWTNTDVERELPLRTVDVRGGFRGAKESLQVVLEGELTADVAWRRGRGGAEADQDLRERIQFLRAMVQRAQREGKRLREVDLTLDDYRQHNAVKYWN